jgi:serine/threonine protein kinase
VVKCYDIYENKSLKIMIIEFCNGGTLQDEIERKIRIPEKEAVLVLKQIINGIAVRKVIFRNCIVIK